MLLHAHYLSPREGLAGDLSDSGTHECSIVLSSYPGKRGWWEGANFPFEVCIFSKFNNSFRMEAKVLPQSIN